LPTFIYIKTLSFGLLLLLVLICAEKQTRKNIKLELLQSGSIPVHGIMFSFRQMFKIHLNLISY